MKIKLNNVFEKYRDTKMFNKINIVKRRNSKVNNEITEDNYENLHRRKGSKSNILQMIKNRLNIKKRYFAFWIYFIHL